MTINPARRALPFTPLAVVVAAFAAVTSQGPTSSSAAAGSATMQQVDAPARVARVALVPGSGGNEGWAIGFTGTPVPGWHSGDFGGQLVFLHYLAATGWQIDGPPTGPSGVINPKLSNLALAANGEGWAVGDGGTLIHHLPGQGWVEAVSPTSVNLHGIDLTLEAGGLYGYAVGDNLTVIRLVGGQSAWTMDPSQPAASKSGLTIDLPAVSMTDHNNVWTITGFGGTGVQVYHRDATNAWSLVTIGEPMFDSPPGATQGSQTSAHTVNESANGTTVSATSSGVWFGGRIYPVDSAHPFADSVVGDQARPFTLYYSASGGGKSANGNFTSYCPVVYTAGAAGQDLSSPVCDSTMPLSGFDVSSISAFAGPQGGQALAGGLGLFGFTHQGCPASAPAGSGCFLRLPDSNGYVSSMTMDSPSEGWVSTIGGAVGAGGVAYSQSVTLGHWTTHPANPTLARWPQYNKNPLEAVAMAPDGSGDALAVGALGAGVRYSAGIAWNLLSRTAVGTLHAVAWPATTEGWAVGAKGSISRFNGTDFTSWPQSQALTSYSLFGVAFANPGTGWAVGEHGTILDYSGGRWHIDPASNRVTQSTLYAIAATPSGAVAVGDGGAVVELAGGAWTADSSAGSLLQDNHGNAAPLYAVSALPDGAVVIGGASGVFISREGGPGHPYQRLGPPLDGLIVAASAWRDAEGRIEAAVSLDPRGTRKFSGDALAVTAGWVYSLDARGWHDAEYQHRQTMWVITDTAAPEDPVLGLATQAGGRRGWAVGGFPPALPDDESQSYEQAAAPTDLNPAWSGGTSSVFRFDLDRDPSPPSVGTAVPVLATTGFNFVFMADTNCSDGICGGAYGSGPESDVLLQEAVSEINLVASGSNNPPGLVMFGGNMRRAGLPEELAQFQALTSSLTLPVFPAIGPHDLLADADTGAAAGGGGSAVSTASSGTISVPTGGSNGSFLQQFANAPAPFGRGAAPAGIVPVPFTATAQDNAAVAHSHYGFDYAPGGSPLARFLVVDDSQGNISGTTASENPREDQSSWLKSAIQSATIPSLVFMSVPPTDPRTTTNPMTDSAVFDADVAAPPSAASGIFSGSLGLEGTAGVSESVNGSTVGLPEWIGGEVGAPLSGTRLPQHGYYHAWLLVNVDPSKKYGFNQAAVTVQAFPILESLAINSQDGVVVKSGAGLRIRALGRMPAGGDGNAQGSNPDPTQSYATYLDFPQYKPPCGPAASQDFCAATYALVPQYKFFSENPAVANFVKACPGPQNPTGPCVNTDPAHYGQPIPDPTGQDGYLCTFKPGTVYIDAVAGVRKAREQIVVGAGSGPCHVQFTPLPPVPPVIIKEVVPVPKQVVPDEAARPIILFHPPLAQNQAVVLAPPPPPVVAPAPPPAAGAAKKEQRQKAVQSASEGGPDAGRHAAMAIAPSGGTDSLGYALAGSGMLLTFMVALALTALPRARPNAAWSVEEPGRRRRQ
ncbi:MAG: beta propeller repeat protein [Candidatus Dormibacteria bacterium]